MRRLLIAIACMLAAQSFAQLDPTILKEIKAWRKGERPPARLLQFPDGKIPAIAECGLRAIGESVEDYVAEILDADLLAAILFDPQVETDTFRAVVRRLVRLKGIDHLSQLLTDRRKADPSAFERSNPAMLFQLLRSPYVGVRVARISRDDMDSDKAEKVLRSMKVELDAGASWAAVYAKFSELNPDLDARAKDPKSIRTLICYLYDGMISPDGFDILEFSMSGELPREHVRALFPAKRGVSVLRASDGVYLYQVTECYDGAANTPSQGMPRPARQP